MSTTTKGLDNQKILNEAMNIVQAVKDGEVNPLDVYGDLNELKKGIDELRKELYNETITEIDKYDNKEDVIRGPFQYSIGRRRSYKYKQDPEYTMLEEDLKKRENLIKQATEKGEPITNKRTGETVDPVDVSESVYPIVKYNQSLN